MYKVTLQEKTVTIIDPLTGEILVKETFASKATAKLFYQVQLKHRRILEAQTAFVASCKQDQHMSDTEIRRRFFS